MTELTEKNKQMSLIQHPRTRELGGADTTSPGTLKLSPPALLPRGFSGTPACPVLGFLSWRHRGVLALLAPYLCPPVAPLCCQCCEAQPRIWVHSGEALLQPPGPALAPNPRMVPTWEQHVQRSKVASRSWEEPETRECDRVDRATATNP